MNTSKVPPFMAEERNKALDALRGLAVILMVQQHLGVWLVDRSRFQIDPAFIAINLTGGAAAPLFIFLSGCATAMSIRTQKSVLFRRGLLLLCIGFGLNLIVPSWFTWGSFYVLHLLGAWLCFAALVPIKKPGKMVGLAFLLLLLTVLMQTHLETPIKLTNALLKDLSKPGGAWRLALLEGHFPLLPWLSVALFGAAIGRKFHSLSVRALFFMSVGLAILGLITRLPCIVYPETSGSLPLRSICRVSFYPPSVTFIVLLTSICVALLAGFRSIEESKRRQWLLPLIPFGRTSLTLLVLHVYFFREAAIFLGFKKTLAPLPALFIIVAFLNCWWVLADRWGRKGYRYGLEWALRKLSKSSR